MPFLRSDTKLLKEFRAGSPKALERVYWAYVRRVDGHLRSMARVLNAPDMMQAGVVADLIQDTFVRAFSDASRRGYDESRDYGPYLATIARNRLIDVLRARGREILVPPDELTEHEGEKLEETPASYDPRVVAALRDYLAQLPEVLNSVYQQRFVLGRSQETVCELLGISRRTLRTREDHLRKGLRKALKDRGLMTESNGVWRGPRNLAGAEGR